MMTSEQERRAKAVSILMCHVHTLKHDSTRAGDIDPDDLGELDWLAFTLRGEIVNGLALDKCREAGLKPSITTSQLAERLVNQATRKPAV